MNTRFMLRLTMPLLAASLLLLTVAVATAWYVQRLQANVSEILTLNVASMRAAEELEIGLREVRNQLDRFLLTADSKHLEAVPPLRRETDRWLAEAERVGTTPRERHLVARIKQGYAHFFTEFDRLARTAQASDREQVRRLIDRMLTEEILAPAHAYLDLNEEMAASAARRNRLMSERMVSTLFLLGICGLGAGGLAGFGLARHLSRSIVRLRLPIRDATGRLSEVAGPVTLPRGWGLEELETALGLLASQVGAVVERLQQSQRETLRAEQLAAVGQLAAGFAHEVRNPLMSMKILVQSAVERGNGIGLSGRPLAILEEEITRLEQLTTAFLDFARPSRLHKEACDVGVLMEDVIDLLAWRAGQRDVRIESDLPAASVWVEADTAQLRQVILNLLLNALEAVPNGGRVHVRLAHAQVASAPPSWLEIQVRDTGPGLPSHLGRNIFDPFVSTKPTGLGLGLSLSKRIAEAHGGQITATDAAEGGAVFTLRLPCQSTGNGVRHADPSCHR